VDRGLPAEGSSGLRAVHAERSGHLRGVIQPGDVLLVEGNNRISGIIKYLTQSTWSHAALFVGPIDGASEPDGEPHVLIEANIGEGVTSARCRIFLVSHPHVPPCWPVL